MRSRVPALVVSAALAAALVAPALAAPAAAAQPAAATPSGALRGAVPSTLPAADTGVLSAARALAAAQGALSTLRLRIPQGQALVASTGVTAAETAAQARTAAAASRAAHREASAAAKVAQRATTREQLAARRSQQAAGDVKRLAREIYINGAESSDLALFVGFASGGPSALSAMTRRDIALNNAGGVTLTEAERAAARAAAATATALQARNDADAAQARFVEARDAFVAARHSRTEAGRAYAAAKRQLAADERAMTTAAEKFRTAQANYEEALTSLSGPGGPPISAGNQGPVVWGMLIAAGFSEEATAGILGNLQQESNIDPTTLQNGGPGRGMAQWSQGGRFDNGPNSLVAFAKREGTSPWNVVTQVKFMIFEMEEVLSFDLERFKQMDDIVEATVYFHDVFEASADSDSFVTNVRGGYAKAWYEALAGSS